MYLLYEASFDGIIKMSGSIKMSSIVSRQAVVSHMAKESRINACTLKSQTTVSVFHITMKFVNIPTETSLATLMLISYLLVSIRSPLNS